MFITLRRSQGTCFVAVRSRRICASALLSLPILLPVGFVRFGVDDREGMITERQGEEFEVPMCLPEGHGLCQQVIQPPGHGLPAQPEGRSHIHFGFQQDTQRPQ